MNTIQQNSLRVTNAHQGLRIDRYLVQQFPERSRNYIQHVIANGSILLNCKKIGKNSRVKEGDHLQIIWPDETKELEPDDTIKLSILYEDEAILVVDKQPGLVVHPGAGNWCGTLVNALLAYDNKRFSAMADQGNRPGIVHRLDKDTSGTMIIAKTDSARMRLISLFKNNQVEKTYLTLVYGTPRKPKATITTYIGRNPNNRKKMSVVESKGKAATTDYEVLATAGEFSLLKINLHSGRTHQIRVHLAHLGIPVVGDSLYLKKRSNLMDSTRQILHAWKLKLPHPITHKVFEFTAPIPDDFLGIVEGIGINLSQFCK